MTGGGVDGIGSGGDADDDDEEATEDEATVGREMHVPFVFIIISFFFISFFFIFNISSLFEFRRGDHPQLER
eukprot:CAMPEP_0175078386 /NCGR_PEP_ID=MMETSP0052_2-20121109/24076_1 /TAXON_ID=51329 ORGANISM="Polytomella parva, Strain SAG 63-3" /NCGR_SAMPLE_ID=MMETSP0052_2 /ASSEMBLY_ACC=CAM_ASM_000194 /LENGTH=71 /DNA_ID=CAMNT_0016348275 /DNA_START=198 /DNA_END=413 /DNA_ORIENTATION=-